MVAPDEIIELCNTQPVVSRERVPAFQDGDYVKALLLSRTHIKSASSKKTVLQALNNLFSLRMPFINRILEAAAFFAYYKQLSIYIAAPGESIHESQQDRVNGCVDRAYGVIYCRGDLESLESTLIHELTHFALDMFAHVKESTHQFLEAFKKECVNQPTFEQQRSGHWAYRASIQHRVYLGTLNYQYFKPEREAAKFPRKINERISSYQKSEYQEEYLPYLMGEFVNLALKEDSGYDWYAIQKVSNGQLQLFNIIDDADSFYRAIIKTLKYEARVIENPETFDFDLLKMNTLKKRISDYIQDNGNLYSKYLHYADMGFSSLKEYLDSLTNTGEIDNIFKKVVSQILQRPLVIMTEKAKLEYVFSQNLSSSAQPIFLYRYDNHYDAVLVINLKLTNGRLLLQEIMSKQSSNQQPFYQKMQKADHNHQAVIRSFHGLLFSKILSNMPQLRTQMINHHFQMLSRFTDSNRHLIPKLADDKGYIGVLPNIESTDRFRNNLAIYNP